MASPHNIGLQRMSRRWRTTPEAGALGRRIYAWFWVRRGFAVFIGLTLISGGCATTPQPPNLGTAGPSALSGEWAGTFEARQAGECTLKGKSKSNLPIRMKIEVTEGGDLTILQYRDAGPDVTPARITGALSPDWRISARRTFQAKCSGVPHESETVLAGRVSGGSSGSEIRMSGVQAPCPDNGCRFNVTYRLVKTK